MGKKYNELEDSDYKNESFEAEGRVINFKTAQLDKMIEQEFINLNETDKQFITYSLGDADDLLKTLPDGNKDISNFTAKDLDDLLFLWNNKRHTFKNIEENQFISAVGAAFGHYLNNNINTVWTIVSDEYGTDYSCTGITHSFQLFPFSSVWKAIEQNREDSLNAIVLLVKEKLDDFKEND